MKCEWKSYKLYEIANVIDSLHKTPQYTECGIPMLRVTDIKEGYLSLHSSVNVSAEIYHEFTKKHRPQQGDIVISRVGTCGIFSYVATKQEFCLGQNTAIIIPHINRKFLYYSLVSPKTKQYLNSIATGSTQKTISLKNIKAIPLSVPDDTIQEKIADTLSGLDDKIQLNNKINENLQQQAFALFEKFLLDAEDGECQVSDIAYLNPKRSLAKNQTARCIDMSQLSTTGAFPSGWEMKAFTGGMRFANGDTLLARITPCLENGKAAYISFLDENEIAFGSTEYIVLAPKPGIPPEYLYCLARYPAFVDYAVKNMNGSSGRQRVTADTIGQYSLPKLSDEQYRVFDKVCAPLFRKMEINWQENRRLAQLRDALLPKLMNGEIELDGI